MQQPADHLGGIAVPLVLGGKGGADLGLAWIVGLDVGRAVADEPIGSAQGHGKLVAGDLGSER